MDERVEVGPGMVQARGERRAYWTDHVEQWRGSGLTQKGYCEREGVSLERFGSWKRRFDREGRRDTGALVAVPPSVVSMALQGRGILGLVVDGRYRVEIPERFSPATLESVLRVIAAL